MIFQRPIATCLTRRFAAAWLVFLLPVFAGAQGVSTAGVRGSIRAEPGRGADARIHVRQEATGFSVEVRASGNRFLVQGLEPGGPYTITARGLGFMPQRREGVFLKLGELHDISFVLQSVAARLDSITVVAGGRSEYRGAHADGGTGLTIPASLLDRLPTVNRDLYDFVRLVPQISTKIGLPNAGLSAGGVGFRFNNFLINGVSDRTLGGGVSGAFAGSRSIPLDAVQEYQVLLSPYDVRYGDFAGALINAVTKSGTNTFGGLVFAYGRNDALARSSAERTPYDRAQYGFSLGGPILRDRLHFFVATDLQHFTFPAAGPYVGQPSDAEQPVPVSAADLGRFDAIMRSYGLNAGSPGPVENGNPLRNLFTRLDLALPAWNSRLLAWNSYSGGDDISFSRAARDEFSLSSYQVKSSSRFRTNAAHLHTALPRAGGGHNELLVSLRSNGGNSTSAVQQPIVRVSVPSVTGGSVTLNSGTHAAAQGTGTRSAAFGIKDNLTVPLGARHVITLGGELERFRIRRGSGLGSYGTWSFASLRDFELGTADRYDVRIGAASTDVPITGTQYAAYASDRLQMSDRLSVTAGIRGDLLAINERAPYHALVDSLFGRRTDEMPRRRVELSPRAGFVWEVSGTRTERVRGGAGIFTGRYPLAWAHTALSSYGVGGVPGCNSLGGAQFPPLFNPDYRSPPTACSGGLSLTTTRPGDVDLLDRNLRMMRVMRASIAYDRQLPGNLLLTNEGLFTRALSDFVLVNLNLAEPGVTDFHGRTMYGTIRASGAASPASRSPFTEVIDLRNTARNRSFQLSTRLEKVRAGAAGGSISYTFSHVRDVQTPLRVNTRGIAAWAVARATSGRHDDLTPGISSNDVPHRIVAAGTYVFPWQRRRTELSFFYAGESGRPFTFLAFGTLNRGDLNADGSNANDPVYVPRSALDSSEIRFTGFSDSTGADNSTSARAARERLQRIAFEDFVERTSCLRRQRGEIQKRNSCREPWSNTTIASLRQVIPIASRALEAQLDVFNVLNLLNGGWGHRREAAPALLEHVSQTVDPARGSQPVFRFNAAQTSWRTLLVESAFQLQLALRYRF
ncbi:MAG TPA: hypothetical protein VNJ04_04520 [Gemmatimonadaceae bacterium]|nr:hypothetical protein [Gemmatimonadaceae bacterium]